MLGYVRTLTTCILLSRKHYTCLGLQLEKAPDKGESKARAVKILAFLYLPFLFLEFKNKQKERGEKKMAAGHSPGQSL